MVLTENETKLAAVLLDMAGDKFANHGCNDFRISDHVEMTADERRQLDADMHRYNGDPKEHNPDRNHDWQSDFCLMFYLATKLGMDPD